MYSCDPCEASHPAPSCSARRSPPRRDRVMTRDPAMNSGLSLAQIALLAAYVVGMAGGQLLFKTAALHLPGEAPLATRLVSLLQNGFFLGAVALYAALSVLWVWVLTFTPLSRAYPF